MNQFFYQITRKASDLINSDDYRERNITRQTAFTRNRKLSFPVMIVLLLNFLTRTMQIELDDFFANVLDAGTDSVTKQAFFKARKNILPDAFKELFLTTRDMVLNKNKIKRHKGYRILAIDGSELRLDKTKENKDIFLPRNHSPENKTNAEISLLYDVISHYVMMPRSVPLASVNENMLRKISPIFQASAMKKTSSFLIVVILQET